MIIPPGGQSAAVIPITPRRFIKYNFPQWMTQYCQILGEDGIISREIGRNSALGECYLPRSIPVPTVLSRDYRETMRGSRVTIAKRVAFRSSLSTYTGSCKQRKRSKESFAACSQKEFANSWVFAFREGTERLVVLRLA